MVDVPLAWRLFQAVDLTRTAVVLVGDHNQLPPVGPGNLLRDLVRSRAIPTPSHQDHPPGRHAEGELHRHSLGEVRATSEVQTARAGPGT